MKLEPIDRDRTTRRGCRPRHSRDRGSADAFFYRRRHRAGGRRVSYTVRAGETLGVVGEIGCGKSVTALSILRLVADPPGRIVGGAIRFEGTNLLELSESEMEDIRGNDDLDDLPGADDLAQPADDGRPPDQRSDRAAPGRVARATRWTGRSRCCAASTSRSRSAACTPIRTSFPAACGSA